MTTSTNAEPTTVAPLPLVKNRDQLIKRIARLGVVNSLLRARQARLQASVDRHQAKLDAIKERLGAFNERDQARIDALALEIYHFLREEGEVDPNETYSRELVLRHPTGIVRFYTSRNGATTFPEGEEAAVREIFTVVGGDLDRFLELVKCEPRKGVIKTHRELIDQLTKTEVGKALSMAIEPGNTDTIYRTQVGRLEHLLNTTA